MKNVFAILFIFLAGSILAQEKNTVFGPEAKNKKIWNVVKENTTIVIGNPEKFTLRSKDFKNYKPWSRKVYTFKTQVVDKKKKQVYGGKAKNKKAWKN